jgi:hypothetical protein
MLMAGWREEDGRDAGRAVAVPVTTTPTVAKGAVARKRVQADSPEPASPPNGIAKRAKEKRRQNAAEKPQPKAAAAAAAAAAKATRYPLRSRSNK